MEVRRVMSYIVASTVELSFSLLLTTFFSASVYVNAGTCLVRESENRREN